MIENFQQAKEFVMTDHFEISTNPNGGFDRSLIESYELDSRIIYMSYGKGNEEYFLLGLDEAEQLALALLDQAQYLRAVLNGEINE